MKSLVIASRFWWLYGGDVRGVVPAWEAVTWCLVVRWAVPVLEWKRCKTVICKRRGKEWKITVWCKPLDVSIIRRHQFSNARQFICRNISPPNEIIISMNTKSLSMPEEKSSEPWNVVFAQKKKETNKFLNVDGREPPWEKGSLVLETSYFCLLLNPSLIF